MSLALAVDELSMILSRHLTEAAGAPTTIIIERRTAGRLLCQDITSSLGRVTDISAGGLRIMATRRPWLGVGAPYQCTLHTPIGTFVLGTSVTRIDRKGMGRFEIGLCIEHAEPEIRQTLNMIARSLCKPYSIMR